MLIRLNKYIGNSGLAPRRKIEELIKTGQIKVNGITAEPGMRVNTETDIVTFKNILIKPLKNLVYIALNKPINILSSVGDPHGRKTVLDLVKSKERLYPIGRLDYNSTGLILLTNDGDLTLKLTHPRYHLPKTYFVGTKENITNDQLKSLSTGITIDNKKTLPTIVTALGKNTFNITLYQGIKHQIRIMCRDVGLSVETLHRTSIGPIDIGNLKSGEDRKLNPTEIERLNSYILYNTFTYDFD